VGTKRSPDCTSELACAEPHDGEGSNLNARNERSVRLNIAYFLLLSRFLPDTVISESAQNA